METFTIEQTNSGYTVRKVRVTRTGKKVSRIIGKRTDYEAAQVLIDDYEDRLVPSM
jgi:hypothetical protein